MADVFKVLSIDGGGIRGLLPARMLVELEALLAGPISDHFDLIVGTSTGGILGLGLTVPDQAGRPTHSANDLLSLYSDRGDQIFDTRGARNVMQRFGSVFGGSERFGGNARYFPATLEALLEGYFGEMRLDAALTNVAVTAYDLGNRDPVVFRSTDAGEAPRMRDVARATSAAPTYFPPLELEVCGVARVLADGGLFANNPSTIGLIDALRKTSDASRIQIVSLGTGVPDTDDGTRSYNDLRTANWARLGGDVFTAVMDGTSEAQDLMLRALLDAAPGSPRYWRLQPSLAGCSKALDDASASNLARLGEIAESFVASRRETLLEIASGLAA